MKRTFKTILCAAAAVLAAVSCQKSTEPVQTAEEGKGTIEVRVNGLMGEYNQVDATKAELVNTIRVSWKGGETVYVYDGSKCIGSLVASLEGDEDRYAVLSTDGGEHQIETPEQGTKILTLVYSPLLTEKQEADHDLYISLEAQSGEKAPFVAYATLEYNEETTITGIVVPFKFATSVIKVNCTGLKADTAIDQVTLSNVHTNCRVIIYGDMEPSVYGDINGTITRTGSGTCSADQVNGEGEAVFQIAVPVLYDASEARVLTVAQGSDNFEDKNFTTKSLSAATSVNTVCQLVKKTNLPAGALPGVFSVSATKQVHFSQGNLWYGVGEATTATWNFESNQYDIKFSWDASHVSHFFWSKDASVAYAETYSDGSVTGSDVFFTNAEAETAKADFTVNGVTGKYRTLSKDEWDYLFDTRTMTNGGARYENLTSSGITVGDVIFKGVVLFPDDFTDQANWKTKYTTWEALNSAGLVFLPAAGYRDGSNVSRVGGRGYYWSSTAYDSYSAYYVSFSSDNVTPDNYDYRDLGFSVRLITEAK